MPHHTVNSGNFVSSPTFTGKSDLFPTCHRCNLDTSLFLVSFCVSFCDLSGGIGDKGGVVLCGCISIGIVSIGMFCFFPVFFSFAIRSLNVL